MRAHLQTVSALCAATGILLLALFGPQSLYVFGAYFVLEDQSGYSESPQIAWAAAGVVLFTLGEFVGMFLAPTNWTFPRVVVFLVGRLVQVLGLGIAMLALRNGMVELRWLGLPGYFFTNVEVAETVLRDHLLLFVGLIIVLEGQVLVCASRLRVLRMESSTPAESAIPKYRIASFFWKAAACFSLFVICACFLFTTFMDAGLTELGRQRSKELAYIAQYLQGMMIYPFMAYFFMIVFCSISAIREFARFRKTKLVAIDNRSSSGL